MAFFITRGREIFRLIYMDSKPSNPSTAPTSEAINQQASVWMKRGLALLDANTPASLLEALGYFDEAIKLRRQLPLAANPRFRYGLAACWMNRGDALTRLASAEKLAAALRSYDEALAQLRDLPLDDDPLYRRRLAIAWQNRGLILQKQKALTEAEKSFTAAIGVLQAEGAVKISDRTQILATVWMNRANSLILQKNPDAAMAARDAARQTLSLVTAIQTDDLVVAEAGFKARHILCQAIAQLLVENKFTDEAKKDFIAETTDAVDEGLSLAQNWERRGVNQFRHLAQELFRFGTRVYQIYQPHFLDEFLLENLDPAHAPTTFTDNPEMQMAALESVWRAFGEIQRHGFKALNTPEFSGLLERLRALRVMEERLAKLRQNQKSGTGETPVPPC